MIITLMNSLAVLLGLALLFAFVWGAWRHTLEQVLDDPLLADPTPAAKTKLYFTLVGKVLWNIVVLVFSAMYGKLRCIHGAWIAAIQAEMTILENSDHVI